MPCQSTGTRGLAPSPGARPGQDSVPVITLTVPPLPPAQPQQDGNESNCNQISKQLKAAAAGNTTTTCTKEIKLSDHSSTSSSSTSSSLPLVDSESVVDRDVAMSDAYTETGVGCDWLGRELATAADLLLLDCRTVGEFNTSHVRDAIHVVIPSLMLKRLKKGNLSVDTVIKCNESKQRFHSKWKTNTVVVYDGDTVHLERNPTCLTSLLHDKLREDGCRVRYLIGGIAAFQSSYPEHCIGLTEQEESTILGLRNLQITDSESTGSATEDSAPTPKDVAFPVQVLPYLFLGNAQNSGDPDCLTRNGIRYILNVTPNVPNSFEDGDTYTYMQIPINDHWSQNLANFFPAAIAFIDEARQKKCGVLVHCLAGISRSVTVTVAYLMQTQRLSLNDAYDFVKQCKPNISPNFNFMGQLLDFEQSLFPQDCNCRSNGKTGSHNGEDQSATTTLVATRGQNERNALRVCACAQRKETKTYFSSPTCTSSSVSSTSSVSSSSSLAMSSASSSTAFDYDLPPTPS